MTPLSYNTRESLRTDHENIALHPRPQRPPSSSHGYGGVFAPCRASPGSEASQQPQAFFLRSTISRRPELFQTQALNPKQMSFRPVRRGLRIGFLMVGIS